MDEMDKIDPLWFGLVVASPDGSMYYRHISRELSDEDRQAAIDEVIEFAGAGSKIESIRECTRREHVSGVGNCTFGHPRHRD